MEVAGRSRGPVMGGAPRACNLCLEAPLFVAILGAGFCSCTLDLWQSACSSTLTTLHGGEHIGSGEDISTHSHTNTHAHHTHTHAHVRACAGVAVGGARAPARAAAGRALRGHLHAAAAVRGGGRALLRAARARAGGRAVGRRAGVAGEGGRGRRGAGGGAAGASARWRLGCVVPVMRSLVARDVCMSSPCAAGVECGGRGQCCAGGGAAGAYSR